MHIAIDCRMMGPMKTRGIGRYIEELVRAMLDVSSNDNCFTLIVRKLEDSPFQNNTRIRHAVADIHWYGVAEQTRMPRVLASIGADLVHIPHWNVPLLYRGPLAVTIHDLILRHSPASAKASTRHSFIAAVKHAGYRLTLWNAIRLASIIFVPTQFVAHDVKRLYKVNDDRLIVTGEGVTELPSQDMSIVSSGHYLLYVGAAYPHKRVDLLLDAWRSVAIRHADLQLVIAGETDLFMSRYKERVYKEDIPRVRFVGRVTDAQLSGLYQHADAFVFPSSDEGFGLPPLEALSHGCPVISSDSSCLPEVLPKDGVKFFRDGDTDGMISAIEASLSSLDDMRREAGRARQAIPVMHAWKNVAQKTLEGYKRIGH